MTGVNESRKKKKTLKKCLHFLETSAFAQLFLSETWQANSLRKSSEEETR